MTLDEAIATGAALCKSDADGHAFVDRMVEQQLMNQAILEAVPADLRDDHTRSEGFEVQLNRWAWLHVGFRGWDLRVLDRSSSFDFHATDLLKAALLGKDPAAFRAALAPRLKTFFAALRKKKAEALALLETRKRAGQAGRAERQRRAATLSALAERMGLGYTEPEEHHLIRWLPSTRVVVDVPVGKTTYDLRLTGLSLEEAERALLAIGLQVEEASVREKEA